MDKKLKAKWIAALRSGEYKKCRGNYTNSKGGHCCLHVLAVVAGEPIVAVERRIGGSPVTSPLIDRNDGKGRFKGKAQSFKQIANYIAKNM